MSRRTLGVVASITMVASVPVLGACSTTGTNDLTCVPTKVSPSSQQGSDTPRAALDRYLETGVSGLPGSGYHLTGSSGTRSVYSDGRHQVSIGALPAREGEDPVWVVLMTYDCS